jgi:hypothetical protein
MNGFVKGLASATGTALLCTTIYLGSTQPGFAEVDCSKPPKTNFEEATCFSRWEAGLLKKPPLRRPRPKVASVKTVRAPVARTWEEREKQARAFCDLAGGSLACAGYWGWLANNPKPRR